MNRYFVWIGCVFFAMSIPSYIMQGNYKMAAFWVCIITANIIVA